MSSYHYKIQVATSLVRQIVAMSKKGVLMNSAQVQQLICAIRNGEVHA